MNELRLLGCDVAPNHTGFVLMNHTAEILATRFTCDVKKLADLAGKRSLREFNPKSYFHPKKKKNADRDIFRTQRLLFNYRTFRNVIEELQPTHVAIEDYAFSRRTQAYTIAEIAGLLKLIIYHTGIPFRLYTTNDVKLYATAFGSAAKEDVLNAIKEKRDVDFGAFNVGSKDLISYDLADAYILADLVRTEALLRFGKLRLDQLPEGVIRVFQRATKSNPVNLLGREWIVKRD